MRIHVPPAIQAEITSAADWYDDQQSGMGNESGESLQDAFASILRDPQSFPRHEQYAGRKDVRRCPLKRFPYNVVFQIVPGEILVIAVGHHQRRPLYWRNRLR